jgi:hypothetical protein
MRLRVLISPLLFKTGWEITLHWDTFHSVNEDVQTYTVLACAPERCEQMKPELVIRYQSLDLEPVPRALNARDNEQEPRLYRGIGFLEYSARVSQAEWDTVV